MSASFWVLVISSFAVPFDAVCSWLLLVSLKTSPKMQDNIVNSHKYWQDSIASQIAAVRMTVFWNTKCLTTLPFVLLQCRPQALRSDMASTSIKLQQPPYLTCWQTEARQPFSNTSSYCLQCNSRSWSLHSQPWWQPPLNQAQHPATSPLRDHPTISNITITTR